MKFTTKKSGFLFLLAGLVFSLLPVISFAGSGDSTSIKPLLKEGDFAPTFALKNVGGEWFYLRDFAGTPRQLMSMPRKPVVISFFASWCKPCRREIPELQKLIDKLPADSIQAFLINVADDAEKAVNFVAEFKTTMPVLLDKYGAVAEKYCPQEAEGQLFLPTLVVVDRDGKVALSKVGYRDGDMDKIELVLTSLLKQ
ncbi:MAG: TlpA family protein disulfide reductase [Bacteroidetes bacterium]|nr:TlpA family protein disulfide reductase [Bacteroidota bacterium]